MLKHADGARSAQVRVAMDDETLIIEVRDDGRSTASGPSGGHGIQGMVERARVYDGEVAAGPATGGGWQVSCRLDTNEAITT